MIFEEHFTVEHCWRLGELKNLKPNDKQDGPPSDDSGNRTMDFNAKLKRDTRVEDIFRCTLAASKIMLSRLHPAY